MTGTSMVARKPGDRLPGRRPLVDEELADQLLGKAQAEGAGLLGPDGLLSQVTKAVLEHALAEELTRHLGYDKYDPAGCGNGNSRKRHYSPAVLNAFTSPEPGEQAAAPQACAPALQRPARTQHDRCNGR